MGNTLKAEPQASKRVLTKTERLMAKHMSSAWEAPMFGIVVEIDMHQAMERRGDGVTLTDVILADCAKTLKVFPKINAHYGDQTVLEYEDTNIGLAVASENGLTVPVIHNTDTLSLTGIAERRRALVNKVREGNIHISDVTGGTFTVSNLGMFDVKQFAAIINPPQVAILAVGTTTKRYVWKDDQPEWRDICEITLTCDHRAVDGAQAAKFLSSLKCRLEERVPGG